MRQGRKSITSRAATLALWFASTALGLASCRSDQITDPAVPESEPAEASGSLTSLSTTPLSFYQVSASKGLHTCGVTTDNRAFCWGFNLFGELGDGSFINRSRPVAVLGAIPFRTISSGNIHNCGVTTENQAYCWGGNSVGQIGDGTAAARLAPVLVVGGLKFRQVSTGMQHTCGLTSASRIYCWGNNNFGQLGDGTTTTRFRPVSVYGSRSFRQVSAGSFHTCALTTANQAFCWGNNNQNNLGDGTTVLRRVRPTPVATTLTFTQITAGYSHTCAVTAAARAFCWGSGSSGEIGDGTTTQRLRPRLVSGGLSFSRLTAGRSHTCGETTVNQGYCWGLNIYGAVGDGTDDNQRLVPVPVGGGLRFRQLSAGELFTCGKTSATLVYCWGRNDFGQVGDGTTLNRELPAAVVGPM